jgi:uncharacterized protein
MNSILKDLLLGLIWVYKMGLSPFLGARCRFFPSCSEYTAQAIEMHGALSGTYLGAKRILRCRPGGGSGVDEVPQECSRCGPLFTRKS